MRRTHLGVQAAIVLTMCAGELATVPACSVAVCLALRAAVRPRGTCERRGAVRGPARSLAGNGIDQTAALSVDRRRTRRCLRCQHRSRLIGGRVNALVGRRAPR